MIKKILDCLHKYKISYQDRKFGKALTAYKKPLARYNKLVKRVASNYPELRPQLEELTQEINDRLEYRNKI